MLRSGAAIYSRLTVSDSRTGVSRSHDRPPAHPCAAETAVLFDGFCQWQNSKQALCLARQPSWGTHAAAKTREGSLPVFVRTPMQVAGSTQSIDRPEGLSMSMSPMPSSSSSSLSESPATSAFASASAVICTHPSPQMSLGAKCCRAYRPHMCICHLLPAAKRCWQHMHMRQCSAQQMCTMQAVLGIAVSDSCSEMQFRCSRPFCPSMWPSVSGREFKMMTTQEC